MKPITVKDHTIAIDEDRGSIAISAPSGPALLEITLTPAGPLVRLSGAEVEINAPKRIALTTDRFELAAKEAELRIAGDLHEEVGGDVHRSAEGTSSLVGRDVRLTAPVGEITLDANDDVDVRGERVRLNCDDPPMPKSWEEHDRRRALAASAKDSPRLLEGNAVYRGEPAPADDA